MRGAPSHARTKHQASEPELSVMGFMASLKVALTLWLGDIPDDDGWGRRYNIHPAMIGTVTVLE